MNKKYQKMASDLAKAGRYGDDQLIHVSRSELEGLGSLLPSGKLPINPETGQPEAFIFTLPALLISMAIGAGTGAISGGVTAKEKGIPLWEGILTGAGTGAATGMVTAGIGGALAPAGTAAVDAGTKAATEGIAQGIAEGAGQASLDAAVDTSVDASLDAALDATLQETAGNLTTDLVADTVNTNAFDALAQGVEVLDPVIGEVATGGLGEALPEVAQIGADASGGVLPSSTVTGDVPVTAATPTTPTTPTTPDPGVTPADAVVQNAPDTAVETLASETAEDIGTEVLVDGAEEGFFDGLKESALGLKEQAIEKLGPNNVEFLDWYTDSALAMTAPAAIVQATQRSEWDADDEHGYYNGPYDKSWESGPGVSWAAKDGGEVKRRSMKSSNDAESLSRIKSLINMLQKTMNPTIPGKYNPLSDEDIRMKIRPNMPGGMQRVGVTLPFRQGGLASRNSRSGGLGSLRRP